MVEQEAQDIGASHHGRPQGRQRHRSSLPNINKPYVHSGVVQTVVLWDTRNLGYLTVYAGWLMNQRRLSPGATSVQAGRLGAVSVEGSDIILGEPLKFTKANIDAFDF